MIRLDGSDAFCERLYEIEKKTRHIKSQKMALGILRADYLLHAETEKEFSLKNVEINTIASSFGYLATQLSSLYQ